MTYNINWADYPHFTEHHRGLVEALAKGLGDQALIDVLKCPPEQQLARLEQFHTFVLAQRERGSEKVQAQLEEAVAASAHAQSELQAQLREVVAASTLTQSELQTLASTNEALTDAVKSLSARPQKKVAVRMDAPKFDGSDGNRLVHWLLAVERCGVAQLIADDAQMVAYALSNLRGKASEWAYSSLLADDQVFDTWEAFKKKILAMYQPPNNEVLLQAKFFGARQGKRPLHQYVQEMRTLSASITVRPLAESVKVPAFMNGLRHGPARQALFRQMPATMEEAISRAFVEEQSFNSGVANPWQKQGGDQRPVPRGQSSGPTPMDLCGAADVICYNCGKRGHMKSRCYARAQAGPGGPGQRNAGAHGRGRGGRGRNGNGRAATPLNAGAQ